MRVGLGGISGTNILSIGRGVSVGGGGGALSVPVPQLGSEILSNGDFEGTYTNGAASGWSAWSTPTTMAEETAIVYSGEKSQHVVGDSVDDGVVQTVTLGAASWYLFSGHIYRVSGAPRFSIFISIDGSNKRSTLSATDSVWSHFLLSYRSVGQTLYRVLAAVGTSGAPSGEAYFDLCSLRPLVLSSLFSVRDAGIAHAITKANVTIVGDKTWSGVVANLDDASNPQNFVIAAHDGTTAYLTKCVSGTYTDLISVATAHVAGAEIAIRRVGGTDTYQLWYNGSQVGTDQTISDEGIVSNTLHGYFNTYAGNGLSDFDCTESV